MKATKKAIRIAAGLLALLTLIAIAQPAFAAPSTITTINTVSGSTAYFEGRPNAGGAWTDITIPAYHLQTSYTVAPGDPDNEYNTIENNTDWIYQLDYGKTFTRDGSATYTKDASVAAGISNILKFGYPINHEESSIALSKYPGITNDQMRYATACAIFAWVADQAGAATSCFTNYATDTRPKSGQATTWNYFDFLYRQAGTTRTSMITANAGVVKDIYLNSYGMYSTTNGVENESPLPVTISYCSEPYTYTTVPAAKLTADPEPFNDSHEVKFKLEIAKADFDPSVEMRLTVQAMDFAANADISTYTNTTAAGNSGLAYVMRGTNPTPISGWGQIVGKATYNTPYNITKTDGADGAGVAGAKIGIYNDKDQPMFSGDSYGVSNSTGLIEVTNLVPGEYYYKEISAPSGYVINTNPYLFNIEADGSMTGNKALVNYKDSSNNQAFEIFKYDSTNSSRGLAGSYITIYDSTGASTGISKSSDSQGKFVFPANILRQGNYTYRESVAPTGYTLDTSSHSLVVGTGGAVTGDLRLANSPNGAVPTAVPGGTNQPFYIEKVDSTTGAALAGAYLVVRNAANQNMIQQTTPQDGRVLVTGLAPGTYTINEEIAPNGYAKPTSGTYFTVLPTGVVNGVTNNVLKLPNTKSTATTGTGSTIQVYLKGTTTPVQGVVLNISSSTNTGLAALSGTSDASGRVSVSSLPMGSYSYKVTQVPETYAMNNEVYAIQSNGNGTVTGTLIIYVDYITLSYKKVDSKKTDKLLSGATFTLYDANSNEVANATTGEDGMAKFTKLKPGKYSVKETKAPKGYTPSNEVWTAEITAQYVNKDAIVVKNSGSVQTGVDNPYEAIFYVALAFAVCIVAALYAQNRKQKKSDRAIAEPAAPHADPKPLTPKRPAVADTAPDKDGNAPEDKPE